MDSQSKTKSVPFCKFCFDSGKPEKIVHSHWIKDKKDGKPCCPTLATTKCGYCKAMGHTPKFCPRLASRDQRRKIHEARMAKRNHQHCGGACVGDHMGGVQKQMKQLQLDEQKRKRVSLGDNAYASLINCSERDAKRSKAAKTKPAPVWNGPKATAPRAPQGAWGKAAKAVSVVKDMTADEVSQLKVLLSQMGIFGEQPFAAEAAAAQAIADEAPSTEQQAWLEAQISKTEQSLEETADGVAFFDNDADAEDAVMALADAELPPAPKLVRQSAFGAAGLDAPAPRPVPMRRQITTCSPGIAGNPPAIQLPDSCDLDADFGEAGNDGWGSD